MASRAATSYIQAYTKIIDFFRNLGRCHPSIRIDNETSDKLEAYIREEKVDFQYVPPGTNRANKAERAICTGKNHVISILCGAHADFPLNLWDETLAQAEITL